MARAVTILGRAKLEAKLRRMPEVAKAQIKAAMAAAADEIVAVMKSLVPVLKKPDDRRRAGALRDSIGWTWGRDAPAGSLIVAVVKGKLGGDLTITIYAGSRDKKRGIDDAYYARWVEFGTTKMSAHPYFYVSYRANKKKAVRSIKSATRKAGKLVAAS